MADTPKPGPPRRMPEGAEVAYVRKTLNLIRETVFGQPPLAPTDAYNTVRKILAENWEHADVPGRAFDLVRQNDVSGVSGTGRVAEGFEFQDGTVALRWLGKVASTNVYASISDVQYVHGHGGSTQVMYR